MLTDRPDRTVTAVAQVCGFNSIDALEKAFRRRFRISPSEHRHLECHAAGSLSEPSA